jgi:AraC-type DNA-binding domain-containing proteins
MLFQEKMQAKEIPDEKSISCFAYRDTRPHFENHCHYHLEIIYVVKNKELITVNGKSVVCEVGDLAFVPSLEPHAMDSLNDVLTEHLILQISNRFLVNGYSDLTGKKVIVCGEKLKNNIAHHVGEDSKIGAIFQELRRLCWQSPNEGKEGTPDNCHKSISENWYLKGMIFSLFSLLYNEGIISFIDMSGTNLDDTGLDQFQPVLKRLSENPGEKFSMEEAARMSGLSYFSFSRTFQDAFGYTFTEYRNRLKVCMAEDLLRGTGKNITEIAELAGFGTLSYFNRIFRKCTGLCPMDYRKQRFANSDK